MSAIAIGLLIGHGVGDLAGGNAGGGVPLVGGLILGTIHLTRIFSGRSA